MKLVAKVKTYDILGVETLKILNPYFIERRLTGEKTN